MRPTGEVVAMVGGKSYRQSPFNRATQARRQPGSTFKLFVYLAALRRGLTPETTIVDAPVTIGDRVWIGCRATVLKGVTIGDGAVVAACSVVTRDVPPRALVAGNPARVVREDVTWEE